MSKLHETNLSSKSVYNGKILKVLVEQVQLPNGKVAEREVVHHPGAVGVLVVNNQRKVVLIKQFRKAIDKVTIEIPAGKLEAGEDPIVCAFRELKEETGYSAASMKEIAKIYTTPGFSNEIIHIYKAEDLKNGEPTPDEDEFVEIIELASEEVQRLINNNDIIDAKTLIALNYFLNENT